MRKLVTFRLSDEEIAQLDAIVKCMNAETVGTWDNGRRVTRTEALRRAIANLCTSLCTLAIANLSKGKPVHPKQRGR